VAEVRPETVVVVGAGVIGCATAYELARSGRSVVLLDAGTIASGVSGGSLAAIARHLIGDVEDLPFVLDSTDRWYSLATELEASTGIDIELRRAGQLRLLERTGDAVVDERQTAELADSVAAEAAAGVAVEMVAGDRLAGLVPLLDAKRFIAASWAPDDGKVNPLLACQALAAGAVRHGATVVRRARVLGVAPEFDGVVVQTTAGSFSGDRVVLATGAGSHALLSDLAPDVSAAIVPKQAQCCATERLPQVIGPVISSISVGVSLGYTQLHQTAHGEILFNTVTDALGESAEVTQVDPEFLRTSARTLARFFPALARARLQHSWAALEAWVPDRRFVVGPVTEGSRVLVAAGDSGTGFLRAPGVARLVRSLLDGDADPTLASRYTPRRFDSQERSGHAVRAAG
jgi:sarcosine oxidase subunit beta